MTIKKIEARSGMTRANIRFYETEGFISPVRLSNGYRDYSETDLEVLLRVKLLRSLHMSLDEVKAAHDGDKELREVLGLHAKQLADEKEKLELAQVICEKMQADNVHYATLDARIYLEGMPQQKNAGIPELETDVIKEESAPFRRYFARSLDFTIYQILWLCLLCFFNINVSERTVMWNFVDIAVGLGATLVLEPILLAKLGTTPGKWILGIGVTGLDGRRLSYDAARKRTFEVLNLGVGFNLAPYSWYRLYKSFGACTEGETLEWEYHSRMTYKEWKLYRIGMCIGANLILFVILFITMFQAARVPEHRGDITVTQFCDNYNRFLKYYDWEESHGLLDEKGNWLEPEHSGVIVVIHDSLGKPEFAFEEENGYLTSVQFSQSYYNDSDIPTYQNAMILAIQSFVGASKEFGIFTNKLDAISTYINEHPYESFEFTVYDVYIACNVEYSGYELMKIPGYTHLSPKDDAENTYTITFTMKK